MSAEVQGDGVEQGNVRENAQQSQQGTQEVTRQDPQQEARRDALENKQEKVQALVGVIMGSQSDWGTMKHACDILDELDIPYEKNVVSAHRTPDLMFAYATTAIERGLQIIIAGAGGAAHLPGMVAAKTILPVIGVPIKTSTLNGTDSLLSIVQMPSGVPVATMAIGQAGATNAGLLAAQILAVHDVELRKKLQARREGTGPAVIESNDQLV